MIQIGRILCPVDFSEQSRHAFAYALALARWYEAAVTLLHVYPPPLPERIVPLGLQVSGPPPQPDVNRVGLMRLVDELLAEHPPGNVRVDVALEESYDTVKGILAKAQEVGADLVVMGGHGRSGFERLVLGSVTEKILRKATCPVLVVPPRAAHTPADVTFHRILCPVDFSDGSLAALEYALSLAQEADARLTLLYAVEVSPELYVPLSTEVVDIEKIRAEAEAASLRRLRELVPESVRTYCTVETVVAEGSAWREILRYAEAGNSDLIVMGVQGRGAVDLLIFGSTTAHVIRGASCPVLAIRGGRKSQ